MYRCLCLCARCLCVASPSARYRSASVAASPAHLPWVVGINGAVIGRKQGPYMHFFKTQAYVSGAHAQLLFRPESGWCIADRGSSNGTKLNDHRLQPDVEMSIKNGDIVTIANVVLKVVISVN